MDEERDKTTNGPGTNASKHTDRLPRNGKTGPGRPQHFSSSHRILHAKVGDIMMKQALEL